MRAPRAMVGMGGLKMREWIAVERGWTDWVALARDSLAYVKALTPSRSRLRGASAATTVERPREQLGGPHAGCSGRTGAPRGDAHRLGTPGRADPHPRSLVVLRSFSPSLSSPSPIHASSSRVGRATAHRLAAGPDAASVCSDGPVGAEIDQRRRTVGHQTVAGPFMPWRARCRSLRRRPAELLLLVLLRPRRPRRPWAGRG